MKFFDVFLSFRGIDTRKNFVSHLYLSLFKKRLRTFKYEEDLLEDQPASPQVLQAIEESKVAVMVISTNYSSSNSCIDELMKILECKEQQSLVVVPVFYEVDLSDIKIQELAFKLGKHGHRDNLERWNDAVIKLTSEFQNYASGVEDDSDMIDKIMDYISPHLSEPTINEPKTAMMDSGNVRAPMTMVDFGIEEGYDGFWKPQKFRLFASPNLFKLSWRGMGDEDEPIKSVKPKRRRGSFLSGQNYDTGGNEWSQLVSPDDNDSLVGMTRHLKSIITLLQLEVSDIVQEIGICGMAGIGKTTLSKHLYGHISQKFQDRYYHNNFLNNITKSGLKNSSRCLLEEITRAVLNPISLSLLTRHCNVVKAKFGHRKVLLIVDGVDHMDQLKNIREISRWFGPGSRIILVTQDKSLLLDNGIKHLYEVEALKYDEALQLFSQFAFKKNDITRGFDRLCLRAVLIAGRIPLALKLLGSFLCGKSIKEWEFELLRLEASQANCTTVVSSYIGGDFYGRRPAKLDGYIVGKEDDGDERPSYWIA